jgi:hypothetical protein
VKGEPMPVEENMRFVRNQSIPTGEVDGEVVALDLDKGSCFGMDGVGSEIWEMAARPVTVSEIADALTKRHDVSRDRCIADVIPFIDDLLAEGLLLPA